MIISALSNCFCNLLVSLSNSLTLRARGLIGSFFLPRFFGARAPSSPSSRCLRHVVRCEEYRPSRLNKAPIAPGLPLQASASSRIFFLYCAENLLLRALAGTSESGLSIPPRRTTPTADPGGSLRSGSLRSPPLRDPPGHHGTSKLNINHTLLSYSSFHQLSLPLSPSSFYINLSSGECPIIIGREGRDCT